MRRVLGAALVALVAASCASGEVSGDRRNVGVVTVIFAVEPARANVGQAVRFNFRLSNNGGRTEHLRFASGKLYDFWIRRGGREIWRWSTGRAFVQQETVVDLPTQSSTTYSATWTAAGRGTYDVFGELYAAGYSGAMRGILVVE